MNKIPILKTCYLPKWLYFLCWIPLLALPLEIYTQKLEKKHSYIFLVQVITAQRD